MCFAITFISQKKILLKVFKFTRLHEQLSYYCNVKLVFLFRREREREKQYECFNLVQI